MLFRSAELDTLLLAEISELLGCEVRAVVGDDTVGHAKSEDASSLIAVRDKISPIRTASRRRNIA